jgi:hypothetical protein
MTHDTPHPLAGTTVTLRTGQQFTIADWWDRAEGMGWHDAAKAGDARAINYAMRVTNPKHALPQDDDVLLGTIIGRPYLAHATEIVTEP